MNYNDLPFPLDIKPDWLNIIRRLQSMSSKNNGTAILTIKVLINENGTPLFWTEPTIDRLEPRRHESLDLGRRRVGRLGPSGSRESRQRDQSHQAEVRASFAHVISPDENDFTWCFCKVRQRSTAKARTAPSRAASVSGRSLCAKRPTSRSRRARTTASRPGPRVRGPNPPVRCWPAE